MSIVDRFVTSQLCWNEVRCVNDRHSLLGFESIKDFKSQRHPSRTSTTRDFIINFYMYVDIIICSPWQVVLSFPGKTPSLPSFGRSSSSGGVSLVSHKSITGSGSDVSEAGGITLLSSKPIDTGYSGKRGELRLAGSVVGLSVEVSDNKWRIKQTSR